MNPHETSPGSAEAPDGGRLGRRSGGDSSPLQARAAFFTHWDWQSIVSINRGACERGSAQHGITSEAGAACEIEWEAGRHGEITLSEAISWLRSFHRKAPFLFFNGNTFAAIGRQISRAVFHELPLARQREVLSAAAHYIAGVLDWESMASIIESLAQSADLKPGDRVQTLRGTLHGTVKQILPDGRVLWIPEAGGELISLPETLLPTPDA